MTMNWKKLTVVSLFMAMTPGITAAEATKNGNTEDPDLRSMLRLPSDERHLVLTEMRNFVIAMQAIMDGMVRDDMSKVSEAARAMGSGAANEIPPHVVAKLPDTFKMLAGKVHMTFDAIALDAEAMGDIEHTVGQLADLTQHCVSCHAIYQIDRER